MPDVHDGPDEADLHGEMIHRLTLLARSCEEARNNLCLMVHLERENPTAQSGLVIAAGAGIQKPNGAAEAIKQTSRMGLLHLADAVKFASLLVDLAIPVLVDHGVMKQAPQPKPLKLAGEP